jgi:hypothetical protein
MTEATTAAVEAIEALGMRMLIGPEITLVADTAVKALADWLTGEGIRLTQKAFTDDEHDIARSLITAGEYVRQSVAPAPAGRTTP